MLGVIEPDANLHCVALATPLKDILHFFDFSVSLFPKRIDSSCEGYTQTHHVKKLSCKDARKTHRGAVTQTDDFFLLKINTRGAMGRDGEHRREGDREREEIRARPRKRHALKLTIFR